MSNDTRPEFVQVPAASIKALLETLYHMGKEREDGLDYETGYDFALSFSNDAIGIEKCVPPDLLAKWQAEFKEDD